MNRRSVLKGSVLTLSSALAGCSGSESTESPTTRECPTPKQTTAATSQIVRLTSIGTDENDDGTELTIRGAAVNRGDRTTTATMTVVLLNGNEVVANRTIELGTLNPDESASFSMTFEIDTSRVNGRRITFDGQ